MIDHHASPYCIDDSLDLIERGIDSVGLRGVLCYEVTDRHGTGGARGGVGGESAVFEEVRAAKSKGRFAGLVGAHAAFTLDDESLDALADMAGQFKSGVHIHVAEDPCDEQACRKDHKVALIDRLDKHGILKPDSIFAHGTHLDWVAIEAVNTIGVTMAHNPRSNMNNSVGYAPVAKFKSPPMLGTDGIGADMFTEAKHAWFKSCDAKAGMTPQQILGMLGASARRASAALGVTLGRLDVGAAADVVVTDYVPFTKLTAENLAGHVIFAMNSQQVRHVLADGKWVLRDREVTTCDEGKVRSQTVAVAKRMWDRMAKIPG